MDDPLVTMFMLFIAVLLTAGATSYISDSSTVKDCAQKNETVVNRIHIKCEIQKEVK